MQAFHLNQVAQNSHAGARLVKLLRPDSEGVATDDGLNTTVFGYSVFFGDVNSGQ